MRIHILRVLEMKRHQTTLFAYMDPVITPNYGHMMWIGHKNFVMTWFSNMPNQFDAHFDLQGNLLEVAL